MRTEAMPSDTKCVSPVTDVETAEDAAVKEYLKALQEDGFCTIENLIPRERCRSFCDCFSALFESRKTEFVISSGVGVLAGAINFAPMMAEYLQARPVVGVAEALLRGPVRVSYTTLLLNCPGVDNQSLHADWPFDQTQASHVRSPYFDSPMHLTSLWALTPPDEDRGATLVIPGSHRRKTNPTAPGHTQECSEAAEGRIVTVPEGGVLIIDSRVWHRRVQNRSSQSRILFSTGYAPWWLNLEPLRPGSDFPGVHRKGAAKDIRVPLVPRDVFEQFPGDAKALFAHWI